MNRIRLVLVALLGLVLLLMLWMPLSDWRSASAALQTQDEATCDPAKLEVLEAKLKEAKAALAEDRSSEVAQAAYAAALADYEAYAAACAEAQWAKPKAPGGVSLLATGGPDAFGYTYIDSASGLPFNFGDISTTGTNVVAGDDTTHGPFVLGFTFNFYGSDYTQLWLSSNGWLSFTAPASSDPSNDCPLPSASGAENLIAGIWDDLDASAAGRNVYYEAFAAGSCGGHAGACFIAQWKNVVHFGTSDDLTFEIILLDNGMIMVQILDASDEAGSGSTTGIENADASSGLTYACNSSGSIADNTAILFAPPPVVNTTNDTDDGSCDPLTGTTDCTLREAINAANAFYSVKDMIKFDIPPDSDSGCNDVTGVCTIQPLSALPVITDTVFIDGYTQPGAAQATEITNADLKIVIDGSQAGDGVDGLVLVTDESTVKGLVIHGFRVADISNYGFVQGNGIVILGHEESGAGNNNVIAGNFIGTDVTGTACVGNGGSGVLIGGSYSTGDTDNNTVGGTDPEDRNIISCNGFQRDTSTPDPDDGTATGGDGVTIRANFVEDSTFYSADGNQVLGNYIGTDVNGTTTLAAGTQTFTYDSQTFDITYIGNTGNGVRIAGGSSNVVGGTVEGERNIISGNELAGVRIEAVAFDSPPTLTRAANNNVVQGNYIGTDVNGTGDLGNVDVGVYIVGLVDDADSNQIGGTTAAARNLISGNGGGGVMILGGQADNNTVQGNYIGTDVNGDPPIPNDADGINITDAMTNTIGGATAAARNLVSGNGGHGISILNNAKAWSPGWEIFLGGGEASGNIIQGNYIGTVVTGTAALSNTLSGILIVDAADNVVSKNLISGNGANGVVIMTTGGAPGNVETNVVTVEGTASGNPVKGSDSATVTVGGTSWLEVTKTADPTHLAASGTVTFTIGITNSSGTLDVAIKRLSDSVHGNLNGQGTCAVPQTLGPGLSYTCVFSATVPGATGDSATDTVTASGTDENGNFVINSDSATVNITDLPPTIAVTKTADSAVVAPSGGTVNFTVTVENLIGSTVTITKTWDTKHGDLIPGVCAASVTLGLGETFTCNYQGQVSGATGNTVEGNFIGTDNTGAYTVPNQAAGVVLAAPDNMVGGATAAQGNLISGNAREGVVVVGASATGNSLWHNLIGTQADGTSALGNGSHGVFLVGDPSDNAIGSSTGVSNTIAYNGGDGVLVFSGTGNQILSNSIFTNTELGIDLGDDNAVTSNDDTDPDTGANNLQNYPVLTTASTDGGTTTITVTLNSITDTTFTIQFFSNTVCDSSAFGEGRTYLTKDTTTTDASGKVIASATVAGDLTGQFVTATTTDPYSNTSEFSNCIPVPAAPVLTINKQVQDLNGGDALAGDTLQYTINYSNTGNAPATGVFITDTYSTFCFTITNVTDGDFPNHDDSGTRLRWPATGGIVLDAQANGSVRYECTLQFPFPNGTTNVTNTTTIKSDQPTSAQDMVTVTVTAAPVLTITKECTPTTGIIPSDTVHCVIQYANTGDAYATDATIVDDYDQSKGSVSNITDKTHFGFGADSGDTITWEASTIPAGESGQLEYDYDLAGAGAFPDVTTQVTNTATITSTETGPEQDTETICIIRFDFNRNGEVDVGDVMAVATRWRLTAALPDPDDDPSTPNYEEKYDVDGDGVITVVDIMRVVAQWGQTCP